MGRVLCSLRHLHGYTAPQLSQAVGITESELLCIERGKCLPPITIIQRLAQALDINEKVIMFFCEDKELLAQCDRKRSEAPLHLRNRLLRMLRFV